MHELLHGMVNREWLLWESVAVAIMSEAVVFEGAGNVERVDMRR